MFPNCEDEHPARVHEGYCYDCQRWLLPPGQDYHPDEVAEVYEFNIPFAEIEISEGLLDTLIERLSND